MKTSLSSPYIGNELTLDPSYDGALASVDLPPGVVGGPYPCFRELLLACEEDEKGLWTSRSNSLEKRYLKVGMLTVNSFGPIGIPTPQRKTNGISSFEISSLIGRPPTNQWTRFIRPALDIYEQNVEIIKTKGSYHVITTKTIMAGQHLFVWFGKDLAAELGLNFLNRINIKDMNTYKCHLCSRQFRRPNPLKSHLLLRHPSIHSSFDLEKLDVHAHQNFIGSSDKFIRGQVFPQPCFSQQGPQFLPMIGALPGHDLNFRDISWPNEDPYNMSRSRVYHRHHHHHPQMKPVQKHLLTDLMGMYSRNPFNPVANYPIAQQNPIAWAHQHNHVSVCPRYGSTPEPKEDVRSKVKRSTSNETKTTITSEKSDEAGSSKTDSENLKLSEVEQESDEHQKFLFKDGIRTRQGYICPYCGKLYSRKYGLKIHVRTHTGFKPLKCKICQRPFGDPSNLNKHVRLHAEGDTPYRCDQCGKVLVRRRDLERHMRSRHSEHLLADQDDLEKSSPIHQQQTVSSSAEALTNAMLIWTCDDDDDN